MKKRVILMLVLSLFVVAGCGKVPALKNGEEVFFQIDGKNVSANDVYDELKVMYARDSIVETMDKIVLESKYEEDDDLKKYVDAQIDLFIQQYGEEGFEQALSQSNMTENDLRAQIALDYRRNLAVEDYIKDQITDDEINDYYESDVRGDIKASHILIKPDTTDESTDEEVKKAEKDALAKAKDIIKRLDAGEKFEDLAKELSDDEGSKEEGGDLGYFSNGTMVDEFENAVVKLENGKYSKEPVKSEFGYHIILKVDQKDKPKLKEVKDKIIDTLVTNKLTEDATLKYKALYEIRKEAGLEIHDDEIKKQYEDYMNSLMNK